MNSAYLVLVRPEWANEKEQVGEEEDLGEEGLGADELDEEGLGADELDEEEIDRRIEEVLEDEVVSYLAEVLFKDVNDEFCEEEEESNNNPALTLEENLAQENEDEPDFGTLMQTDGAIDDSSSSSSDDDKDKDEFPPAPGFQKMQPLEKEKLIESDDSGDDHDYLFNTSSKRAGLRKREPKEREEDGEEEEEDLLSSEEDWTPEKRRGAKRRNESGSSSSEVSLTPPPPSPRLSSTSLPQMFQLKESFSKAPGGKRQGSSSPPPSTSQQQELVCTGGAPSTPSTASQPRPVSRNESGSSYSDKVSLTPPSSRPSSTSTSARPQAVLANSKLGSTTLDKKGREIMAIARDGRTYEFIGSNKKDTSSIATHMEHLMVVRELEERLTGKKRMESHIVDGGVDWAFHHPITQFYLWDYFLKSDLDVLIFCCYAGGKNSFYGIFTQPCSFSGESKYNPIERKFGRISKRRSGEKTMKELPEF